MPTIQFASGGASKLLYKGDPKCPRNVVLEMLLAPGQAGVFVSRDKQLLDNALPGVNSTLTEGVNVAGFPGPMVLPRVTYDIYGRPNTFAGTQPAILAVEAF